MSSLCFFLVEVSLSPDSSSMMGVRPNFYSCMLLYLLTLPVDWFAFLGVWKLDWGISLLEFPWFEIC